MTKDKIVDYVLHTPINTNKAILYAMLDELIEEHGGGGGDVPDIPGGDIIVIYDGGLIRA